MSRVSLVTGGAQRLGREICLALAARGDSVVIHYRGSDKEAARTRDDCLAAGHQTDAVHDKRPVAFGFVCIWLSVFMIMFVRVWLNQP